MLYLHKWSELKLFLQILVFNQEVLGNKKSFSPQADHFNMMKIYAGHKIKYQYSVQIKKYKSMEEHMLKRIKSMEFETSN